MSGAAAPALPVDVATAGSGARASAWAQRGRTAALAGGAGLGLVAAVPPWGWWPAAFVGIALFDRLIAGRSRRSRFLRGWLAAVCWLAPGTVWMLDLTAPGYPLAVAVFGAMFGLAAAAVPAGRGRRLALPAAFVLAEALRWSWPFGGVPLATLAMGQAGSPLAPAVRTLGSLWLVALTVAVGVGLSALAERRWRPAAAVAALVAAALLWAAWSPSGRPVGTLDVAVVQGGGQQRTRAQAEANPLVLQRHVEATASVQGPVDLVLWPENVVNPEPVPRDPSRRRSGILYEDDARATVGEIARRVDAVFLPGWFTHISDRHNDNYTEAVDRDGDVVDVYHKVRTVPFGEFVPLRSLVEPFAGDALPPRDVLPGDGPAVLDTPVGRIGIAISWEIFFDHRARDAMRNGAQLLVNPTNGSSYWLTIVQAQQVASSRLRALETGRWVLQAAPTGFSAIVDPDGRVLQRTAVSEQRVLQGTVELRDGDTLATRVGAWPMLAGSVLVLAAAWWWAARGAATTGLRSRRAR